MSMRFIGSVIDSLFDFFSPEKIAGLVSWRMKPSTAKRRYAGSKMVSRVLLILCLLALALNMLGYIDGSVLKGYELIKMAVTMNTSSFDYGIGIPVLSITFSITFVIALIALVILFVRKFPFRNACWMIGLNALLILAAVIFYKWCEKYKFIIFKKGFYILIGLYILSFCLAIYGRACEKALGFGMAYRDYRYRQSSIVKPAIVIGCLMLAVLFACVVIKSSGDGTAELPVMLKILFAFGIILLVMTICRSEYAGAMAWVSVADTLAWCFIYYKIIDFHEDHLEVSVILINLALSVYLAFILKRKAPAESSPPDPLIDMAEGQQEKPMGLFCAECGTPLGPDDDFCSNCGKRR